MRTCAPGAREKIDDKTGKGTVRSAGAFVTHCTLRLHFVGVGGQYVPATWRLVPVYVLYDVTLFPIEVARPVETSTSS